MGKDWKMNQIDVLKSVIKLLNRAGFHYMISGGCAVSYWGEPRATHDLDVVIEVAGGDVERMKRMFNHEYEVDHSMLDNAVRYHTHFTAIHLKSGMRIDFWMLKNRERNQAEFERRRRTKLFGIPTSIISPEDAVLIKLEWYNRSKNSKHLDDAIGILEVQGDKLDTSYINKWVGRIDIRDLWKKVRAGQYSR